MRYLVIADIHANLPALDAVLVDAGHHGFDHVLLLGDLVGYGAQPNDVVARLAGMSIAAAVRGNHDRVAAGDDDAEGFTAIARQGADWTRHVLTPEHTDVLRALPQGPIKVSDWIEICHGSPGDEDDYVLDAMDVLNAVRASHRPLCLFGHTHTPLAVAYGDNELQFQDCEAGSVVRLNPEWRYLLNVGSVGQPRDGDPRAAYGIADGDRRTVSFYRVPYDVEAAQRAIRDAGLPEALAVRLARGR